MFGYKNPNKLLPSSNNLVFGLNHGHLTKFSYNGKEEAIDLEFKVLDRVLYSRIFKVQGEIYNDDGDKIGEENKYYEEQLEKRSTEAYAVAYHALHAVGVTDEKLEKALEKAPSTFEDWVEILIELLPENFANLDIDIFLEYQWNIRDGNDRTYLIIPRNMKGGKFLVPKVTPSGSWKKIEDSSGMRYVDDKGKLHPFSRNVWYMESNKANQQKLEKNENFSEMSDSDLEEDSNDEEW